MDRSTFLVDYYHNTTRITIQGSSQINLRTASSDFAVQQYLQNKHPNEQIRIMNLRWI
jgi:hypothetical protein